MPYLDYSTPTFYDTLTAAIQKLMAGKDSPTQFLDELQKDYDKFIELTSAETVLDRPLRGGEATSPPARTGTPPGEPRRVGYLYVAAGVRRLRAVRALPAGARGVDVAVRTGTACTAGTWVGLRQLPRRRVGTRRCAGRSCTRWS